MKTARRQLYSKIGVILLFFVGGLIMAYPFYVNALNNYLDQKRMSHYVTKEQTSEKLHQLKEANERLKQTGLTPGADPFTESTSQKKSEAYYQQHLIGKINIPKLSLDLSLFDTTTPALLEQGATVLDGTSYPLGGVGTHAVISAHRGLPERELFTNLPKLDKGDIFLIDISNQTLAYEVTAKQVVEPDETSLLTIIPDEDLVTLVTCTPYMINSHRLLVTGKRVPYTPEIQQQQQIGNRKRIWEQWTIIGGSIVFLLFTIGLLGHQLHTFQLRKRRVDIVLVVQGATPGASFGLFDARGKKPMWRNQEPYQQTLDIDGKVRFTNLPGANYSINYQNKKILTLGVTNKKENVHVFRINRQLVRIAQNEGEEIYVWIL